MSEVDFDEVREVLRDVFRLMEEDIRKKMGEVKENGGREN